MSEHLHAVVVDDVVTTVAVMTVEVAGEFTRLHVYPGATLVNLDGVTPQPGIGWKRAGKKWTPPEPTPPPAPSPAATLPLPAEGALAIGTVTVEDPLTFRTDDGRTWTPPQVVRHAGYTPVAGDSVDATWRSGAWLVADAVVSGTSTGA